MKNVSCTIKGISPLLMNKFPLEPVEGIDKASKEEQAEYVAYRHPQTKHLYVPGVAVYRCMVNAALYSKGKGRASLQKTVAGCVFITPEMIDLGVDSYEIDTRPVVNPTTRGRIIKHRPRIEKWQITFDIEYDNVILTIDQVKKVVVDAGQRVGLLDFRPEKKGPFGRFVISKWEVVQ